LYPLTCYGDAEEYNIKEALFFLKNQALKLDNLIQNSDDPIALFNSEEFVLTETLILLLNERLDKLALELQELIHLEMDNLRDRLVIQLILIFVLSVPLWIYIYYAFARKVIKDVLITKKYLKNIQYRYLEKNHHIRLFLLGRKIWAI